MAPGASALCSQAFVVVIDDDDSVRLSLMSLVRSLGYHSSGYVCADAFLAGREVGRCDCIVTDIQMPGTDGIALKKELDRLGSGTPVIMITARNDKALLARARASGAFAVLNKPLEVGVLIDLLASALSSSLSAA